jgi:hypothetical protein
LLFGGKLEWWSPYCNPCIGIVSANHVVLQVKELFEVEGELVPCQPGALLAGLLRALTDAHWCAALGCPPEPIFAVPISLEVRGCRPLWCFQFHCCVWLPNNTSLHVAAAEPCQHVLDGNSCPTCA